MTPLVWANFPPAALIFLAIAGIPLWMTFKRRDKHPDYSEAREHSRAKEQRAHVTAVAAGRPAPNGMTTARQHAAARTPVPGRKHSGAEQPIRASKTGQHTHTSA